jgi:hypothetical protein
MAQTAYTPACSFRTNAKLVLLFEQQNNPSSSLNSILNFNHNPAHNRTLIRILYKERYLKAQQEQGCIVKRATENLNSE